MTLQSPPAREDDAMTAPGGAKRAPEGYLLLAVERQRYFDMACSLARSLRAYDPDRPVALAVDPSIVVDHRRTLFDHIVVMEPKAGYVGVMHKLRLFDVNPFERALFVDSDCLMARANVSAYWRSFGSGCNTIGDAIVGGNWKGLDVAGVIRTLGLRHLVKMNAGVIFFDRSELSENIYRYMQDLVTLIPKGITPIHQNRPGQYSMEPLLGAAMAKYEVEPLKIVRGIGSLMVSTLYARRVTIDYDLGVSYLEKPNVSSFLELLIPGRVTWTSHSPILMHFVGLKPASVYEKACARLARAAEAP
jgi:hypothetical protein